MAKIELTDEAFDLIEVFAVAVTTITAVRMLTRPGVGQSFANVAERAFNLKFVKTK